MSANIPRFIQETGKMEDYLIDRKRGQNRRETLDFMFVIQQALTYMGLVSMQKSDHFPIINSDNNLFNSELLSLPS